MEKIVGSWGRATLRQASALNLLAAALGYAAAAGPACAKVQEKVIYNFTGGSDGAEPYEALLADLNGTSGSIRALYGFATGGGDQACQTYGPGCGSAFTLTPPTRDGNAWSEKTTWSFTGGADGGQPSSNLVATTKRLGKNPVLYGTAAVGGQGYGTVFSVSHAKLETIYTFGGGSDGATPFFNITADKAGGIYTGTAFGGGSSNCGTIVKLAPPVAGQTAWAETTIWTFTGGVDGCSPQGIVIDSEGALFVSTYDGGSNGSGTIIELTPPPMGKTVWTQQTIWAFTGGNDGGGPNTPVLGKKGVIYGTTVGGGGSGQCDSGCGTVFKLIPPKKGSTAWTQDILWNFAGSADGWYPASTPIIDETGALYGTTADAGANGYGIVYRLNPPVKGRTAWTKTLLWDFSQGDAEYPYAALAFDKAGTLYGSGSGGGAYGAGAVFTLTGTGFTP